MQGNPMNYMKQLADMKRRGMGPEQVLMSMFNGNIPPQLNIALNQMRTSGLNPEQYIMAVAQSNLGIDPNVLRDIFSLFK